MERKILDAALTNELFLFNNSCDRKFHKFEVACID